MEVVEFFQDEVQLPYGVIERVPADLAGTFFLLFISFFSSPIPPNTHILYFTSISPPGKTVSRSIMR